MAFGHEWLIGNVGVAWIENIGLLDVPLKLR
jgi:hypothetical protein